MKYIKKTIKILIVTLIFIITVSSKCMAGQDDEPTTQAPTGEYNGGQQDTDKTHGTLDQFTDEEKGLGFSTDRTGYRFYIAEYEIDDYVSVCSLKKIITPNAVDICMSKPDRDGYIIDRYNTLKEEFKKGITDGDFLSGTATSEKSNVARLGKKHIIKSYVKDEIEVTTRSLPAPIKSEGDDFLPNGQKFRDWMLTPNGEGNNATELISQLWGKDMLEEFLENDNYRLIVEPIMWSSEYIFNNYVDGKHWSTLPKRIFLGTAQEWAYYMMEKGDPSGLGLSQDDSGKGCFINVIYSNALPRSMVLQKVNSIFPVPANKGSERLDALSITSYGYGEHVFRADDLAGNILATTQTYDYKLGTKIGPPPRASKVGESLIIKVYADLDSKGNVVKTNMRWRLRNPGNITVNDETNTTGYTVVGVKQEGVLADTTLKINIAIGKMNTGLFDWNTVTSKSSLIKSYDLSNGAHEDLDVKLGDNGGTLYVLLQKQSKSDDDDDDDDTTDEKLNLEAYMELGESYISKYETLSGYAVTSNGITTDISKLGLIFGSFDASGADLPITPICKGHKKLKCTTEEHSHDNSCGEWCDTHGWWYNSSGDGRKCPGNDTCSVRPACGKVEHTHGDSCYETTYHKFGFFSDSGLKLKSKLSSIVQSSEVVRNLKLTKGTTQIFSVEENVSPDSAGKIWAEQKELSGMDCELELTREVVDAVNTSGQSVSRANNESIRTNVEFNITEDTTGEDVNTKYRANTGDQSLECWKSPYNFAYRAKSSIDAMFKTKVKVYAGMESVLGGKGGLALNLDQSKIAYTQVPNTSSVGVIPYIQMQKQTKTELHQLVTVGGKYVRQITGFKDYGSVFIHNKSSDTNLILESSQWSTHKGAQSTTIDPEQKGYVLPGGAIIDMTTNSGNSEVIAVKTYHVIGDDVKNVSGTSRLTSYEEATQNHNNLVNEVKTEVGKLFIQQYIERDGNVEAVSAGANTDLKYYLRDNSDNNVDESQKNGLSVEVRTASTNKYKVRTDVSGNVYVDSTCVLTKEQSVDELTNELAIDIETKTNAISAIIDNIERNSGNDSNASWVNDGKWYNEAVGDITVCVQTTYLTVGFDNGSPVRGCVIDPELCPVKKGVGEMWSKSYKSWFKSNTSKVEPVKFNGSNIYLNEVLDSLYRSVNFYIPDVNVQDLLN